jgi:hypothetical protein
MNPFRCREQTSRGSRLLLHAILALCYNHMNHNNGSWIIEAMEHKSTAHHLLEGATRIDSAAEIDSANESGVAQELGILDTILILFTLDVRQNGPSEIESVADLHSLVHEFGVGCLDDAFDSCSPSPRGLWRTNFLANSKSAIAGRYANMVSS